jgi:16S rRNA (guanine527-N7)-methyltransferase
LLPEFGPEEFAAATGVSRETLARLKAYVGTLADWNVRHNLVSRASMDEVWQRHVWDSAQLADYVPLAANSLVDLGSGAGFPGLILAILFRTRASLRTVLYESIGKKCDFLETAAKAVGVPVEVRRGRIEDASTEIFDVVTARACAPLSKLLGYAAPFQGPNTVNLFLKGQNVEAELTEAHKYWKMQLNRHPSRTDPSGRILEIREFGRVR